MSLQFPQDQSVQLNYASFPFTTPPLDNYTTSNYVSNISNILDTKINTKQAILTAATNLLGIGSAITALDYTKITINKPTNFQADWTSTIINKPSTFPADMTNIYNKTETNNLLNAKQQAITTYSITGATGGSLGFTSGTLTLAMPNNYTQNMSISNLITPTSFIYRGTELSTTLGNYSTTGNDNNYLKKTGGDMTGNINMNSTSVLNFGTRVEDFLIRLYGSDYGFGINPATLRYNAAPGASHRFYSGITNTATINSTGNITATSFSGDGANITNVPYSTITGKPSTFPADMTNIYTKTEVNGLLTLTNFYNKTDSDGRYLQLSGGSMTGDLIINKTNANIQIGSVNGNNWSIPSVNGYFSDSALANDMVLRSINRLHLLSGGGVSAITINTNNNVGIGITNAFAPLCIGSPLVNGSDGNLVISKRNSAGTGWRNFKMGIDDSFNFCIGDFGSGISANTWRSSDLTINYLNGNVGIGTSNQSYKLTINGSLNATSIYNNGTLIDFSSYALINNYYDKSTSDGRYLQLSGGTMTGNLITSGYVDTKSIALTGADAFFGDTNVDSGNKTNTYINFKYAGTNNDWCYLRQIGGDNGYKMALDFHDDGNDARFCIRNINSVASPDGVTEEFSVDSGNVTMTRKLIVGNLNTNPEVQLGPANGHNLGVATQNQAFSESAAIGDMVLRSINKLILQSGGGGHALMINTNNSISCSGNVGIGTSPDSKLHITTPDNTGITTNLLNFKNSSGYGIYATSTSIGNRGNTLDFLSRDYNLTGGANITNRNLLSLSPDGNVGIGITNPFASLCIGTPALGGSDGTLVISKNNGIGGNRNFKLGFDTNFNFCIGDFGNGVSGNSWTNNQLSINWTNGNIGIGTTGQSQKLYVNGSSYFNDDLTVGSAVTPNQKYGYIGGLRIAGWDPNTLYNESRILGITALNDIAFSTGTSLADYTTRLIIKPNGNIGIGIGTNNPSAKLHIEHSSTSQLASSNGLYVYNPNNTANNCSIIGTRIGGNLANKALYSLDVNGHYGWSIYINGNDTTNKILRFNSGWDGNGTDRLLIKADGTTNINGYLNIHNGSPYAVVNNYMTAGSLTIGDQLVDYGTSTGWTTNTAGLMMECANNTEIVVHDAGTRLASFMYYEGSTNKIFIGRNKGWNAISSINFTTELINQYWKFTNQSDYCRLQNNAGTGYFNFAAEILYANASLQVNSTANINGVLTMGSGIKFKTDVWNTSTDNINRIYYENNACSYYQGHNYADGAFIHLFRDNSGNNRLGIYRGGNLGIVVYGQITCSLYTTTSQNPHDYVGVTFETTSGAFSNYTLYLILNSFTGFHRNFTNDELFDENEPQLFKDTYEGRIVISTGKIATQIGNENDGYDIKYDKEGIFIEDTHSIVELSRNKKDKRVFGVLGRKDRKNSNQKRLIVNSVGEGSVYVINSNGDFQNGDLITTSDYLGYGEKQDSEFVANYTVGKIIMDCDFQLNSPYYNCYEIDDLDANGNKLRVAFVGCVYYCG